MICECCGEKLDIHIESVRLHSTVANCCIVEIVVLVMCPKCGNNKYISVYKAYEVP